MPQTYKGKSKNQFDLTKPGAQRKGQLANDKVSKYKKKKAIKGVDRVLNVDYLKKVFMEKDKMELKLSTFTDNTVNDNVQMSTGVIGDTVDSQTSFFQPVDVGSIYTSAVSTQYGYQPYDAGMLLLQYGQNLTPQYAGALGCQPTGSFSWQTDDTIDDNFSATNDWGNDNKNLVLEQANNKLEGEYVTLKRSIYNLVITMNTLTYNRDLTAPDGDFAGVKPTEFRILHLTSKRKVSNQGDTALNALQNLWLLPTGKQGGLQLSSGGRGMNNPAFRTNQGFSPEEMFQMPVDRSYYKVHSDQTFTLQNSAQSLSAVPYVSPTDSKDYLINQSTINNKFPTQRKLSFVCNYDTDESQRLRGNNKAQLTKSSTLYTTSGFNPLNYWFMEPKDMNFKDIIIILSKKVGTTQPNTSGSSHLWSASGYGTLSSYDN